MALNRCIIQGRLTREVELRHTQSGAAVASFTLACDRDRKDQDGQKQTDFVDVVAWRNTAEFVSKYLSKGRMAVAEGRLQFRDWTANDGTKRRNAEVVADNVYFGDSKTNSDTNTRTNSYANTRTSAPAQQFTELEDDDELPFDSGF